MAKVAPFHGKKDSGVHHVSSKCTKGNNIEKVIKASGTGGGKLCAACRCLQLAGTCWQAVVNV